MRFIAVVPARSGSTSLKGKNMFIINRTPLIEYTFKQLKKTFLKQKYLLSDDIKVRKLAKKYNLFTEYLRPKKVSKSTTSLPDTLQHFHQWTVNKKIKYDYMVILQPTSPLRSYRDINQAIKIVKKKKYRSLFSISESLEHPYETIKINNRKKWSYVLPKSKLYYRRQDFDFKSFFINGAIYIAHRDLIMRKKIYDKKKHGLFIMPKRRSIDINDLDEIKLVKPLLKIK